MQIGTFKLIYNGRNMARGSYALNDEKILICELPRSPKKAGFQSTTYEDY